MYIPFFPRNNIYEYVLNKFAAKWYVYRHMYRHAKIHTSGNDGGNGNFFWIGTGIKGSYPGQRPLSWPKAAILAKGRYPAAILAFGRYPDQRPLSWPKAAILAKGRHPGQRPTSWTKTA